MVRKTIRLRLRIQGYPKECWPAFANKIDCAHQLKQLRGANMPVSVEVRPIINGKPGKVQTIQFEVMPRENETFSENQAGKWVNWNVRKVFHVESSGGYRAAIEVER